MEWVILSDRLLHNLSLSFKRFNGENKQQVNSGGSTLDANESVNNNNVTITV